MYRVHQSVICRWGNWEFNGGGVEGYRGVDAAWSSQRAQLYLRWSRSQRMVCRINFSRHSITEVSMTGQQWFGFEGLGFLGTGMIVNVFQRVCIYAHLLGLSSVGLCSSLGESSLSLTTLARTPSGPGVLPGFVSCVKVGCASSWRGRTLSSSSEAEWFWVSHFV